ncbi:MAG: hypothetical protein WCN81_01850 [Actinomycetes bacterium]
MTDVPDEVQRWTAKRHTAVAMIIVKGETLAGAGRAGASIRGIVCGQ